MLLIFTIVWNDSGQTLHHNGRWIAIQKQANIEIKLIRCQCNYYKGWYKKKYSFDALFDVLAFFDTSHVATLNQCHTNSYEQEHFSLLCTAKLDKLRISIFKKEIRNNKEPVIVEPFMSQKGEIEL